MNDLKKLAFENEFVVNKFITLKLEEGKTHIYVNGNYFNQCKILLLNIPVNKISSLDEIESIDDAIEKIDQLNEELIIHPEFIFWGHCSNLQVWAEYNYDSRLLHRNLAFPLLKELVNVGDPIAKQVFKEEIAKRIESGNLTVIIYLLNEGYLRYLEKEESENLLEEQFLIILNKLESVEKEYYKIRVFLRLIEAIKGTEILKTNYSLIKKKFTNFLVILDKMSDDYLKLDIFSEMITIIKETDLMKDIFDDISTVFEKIPDKAKLYLISLLIPSMDGTGLMDFNIALNIIDNLPISYRKILDLSRLINAIKRTKVLKSNYVLIKKKFAEFLKDFEYLRNASIAFISMITNIKGTELVTENFTAILDILYKLPEGHKKKRAFTKFIDVIKFTNLIWEKELLIKEKFPEFLHILEYKE